MKTELEAQLGLIIFNPVAQHELVIRFIIVGIFQDTAIGQNGLLGANVPVGCSNQDTVNTQLFCFQQGQSQLLSRIAFSALRRVDRVADMASDI